MKLLLRHIKGQTVTVSQKVFFPDGLLFQGDKIPFRFHGKLRVSPAVPVDHQSAFHYALGIIQSDLFLL